MKFTAWKRLQDDLQSLEAAMVRRDNVIRFLVGRFVLMLAMVVSFWFIMRDSI